MEFLFEGIIYETVDMKFSETKRILDNRVVNLETKEIYFVANDGFSVSGDTCYWLKLEGHEAVIRNYNELLETFSAVQSIG